MFAPPPPPPGGVPGGIGAITAVLMRELAQCPEVAFASPARKEDSGRFGIRRGVLNIVRLVRETARVRRGGTVLIFSSAGFSFWEKCLWSLVVRSMGRAAAVVMVAGDFPSYFATLGSTLQAVARSVFRGAHVTIGAQSPAWRDYFRATFRDTRVECVSTSVDREFFEPRVRSTDPGAVVRLLYVGWVTEAKGILDLLDAIAIVAAHPTQAFQLRLVGPIFGGLERWQAEVDQRGIGAMVTLAGSVDHRADLLREYRSADIFVFPSHFEGFPQALVEAAAVGLPCIGSHVGGIPDILDDGHAGIIVSAHSPGEIAAALLTLLRDSDTRAAMGRALRQHAVDEYSREACAASYLQMLGIQTRATSGSQ